MGPVTRRGLLVTTAVVQVVVGAVVLLVAIALAADAGLGGWAALIWAVPTVLVTWRAVRSERPARVEDDQPWNEYVLRATLIGSGQVRPVGLRLATGLVLGGPLALFVAVLALFELGAAVPV